MDSRPRSRPLVRNHHYYLHVPNPLLRRYPGVLQDSVNDSRTLSHPCLNHCETIVTPSPKYPPTSLLFVVVSLPVMCFDVFAVAPPPISVMIAPRMFALGAWSLPLVMPNTTAPFHVVVRLPLPIATTPQEVTTSRILGSEVVPQVYNGGNVTE